MKCINCDREATHKKKQLCDACKVKEWRKNNPDKIKAYLEKNNERIRKWCKDYYKKNIEKVAEYNREYKFTKHYKELHNSQNMKVLHTTRHKTRLKYPLAGQKCGKCPNPAVCRHHTTNPIEVDKFMFLCHKHHMEEHNRNSHKHAVILGESAKNSVRK